jgi:septal ring factor EnvC (AmiA/AmiB activator)
MDAQVALRMKAGLLQISATFSESACSAVLHMPCTPVIEKHLLYGTLMLLLQIDMLEHKVKQQQQQQQQPSDGQQTSSNEQQQQQQHLVEQQLRHQLATTQQQLARLQEEHMQYVDRTSNLLVRLQAQMQQLMKQAPGLAAGAGEGMKLLF